MTLVMGLDVQTAGLSNGQAGLKRLHEAAWVRNQATEVRSGCGCLDVAAAGMVGQAAFMDERKLVRFIPVRAVPDIDQQGHAEFRRALHPYANAFTHRLDGVRTYLEYQLVVDLHQHVGVVVTFS